MMLRMYWDLELIFSLLDNTSLCDENGKRTLQLSLQVKGQE